MLHPEPPSRTRYISIPSAPVIIVIDPLRMDCGHGLGGPLLAEVEGAQRLDLGGLFEGAEATVVIVDVGVPACAVATVKLSLTTVHLRLCKHAATNVCH